MKPDTHPELSHHQGRHDRRQEFTTRTTWGKPGDTMHLDMDPESHPAWTGGHQQLMDRGGRLSRFQKKFSGFLKGRARRRVFPGTEKARSAREFIFFERHFDVIRARVARRRPSATPVALDRIGGRWFDRRLSGGSSRCRSGVPAS